MIEETVSDVGANLAEIDIDSRERGGRKGASECGINESR